jgi:tRNA A-37 threonylcarbamoyl transferase component Bud32
MSSSEKIITLEKSAKPERERLVFEELAEIAPGTIVGEYAIEGLLAKGGMASVYSAAHQVIGKKAAIKVISQNLSSNAAAVDAFLQEARIINQIRHPNIVDVFAFGSLPDERSYFIMEWLEGETLRDRLERGRLPLGESYEILIQVCDALDAAHEKRIVHLDLKPDNVYLVPVRGRRTLVKLLDFGIARLFTPARRSEPPSAGAPCEQMAGTPAYASPEQAQGNEVDQRSDVYSLGVMAFEMILGDVPFDADTIVELLSHHIKTPPPRPRLLWPAIPPILERLLLDLLDKDPERRPTLSTVHSHLTALLEAALQVKTKPAWAPLGGTAKSKASPRLNRRILAAFLIVTMTALLGGAGWSRFGRRLPPAPLAPHALPVPSIQRPAEAPQPAGASPPAQAERHAGILAVMINAKAARFELDGRLVAAGAPRVELALGGEEPHTLVVRAPGYRIFRRRLSVAAGQWAELTVKLIRAHERRSDDSLDYLINPWARRARAPRTTTEGYAP